MPLKLNAFSIAVADLIFVLESKCAYLSRMKKFYEEYKDLSNLPMALAKLPWSHNNLLLDKIKELNVREWYAEKCFENGCFVGNQYKISTENQDYYIDMLFYHLDLRCYIIVELKNVEFKPEYIGQLSFYVTAVDETLRKELDNQTIGLLLCKGKDKLSVEWALKGTNIPIGVTSYEVKNELPREVLEKLPTEEDINKHIDITEDDKI